MEWLRYEDRDGGIHYKSERANYKKLVDDAGQTFFFDRDKISAYYEILPKPAPGLPKGDKPRTVFLIEGAPIVVTIDMKKALAWMTEEDWE